MAPPSMVFAHRGSSVLWPENTMIAFERARAAGATGFETDLRLSSDGQIVLSHDDALGRLGHEGASISRLPAADLCRLPVRSPDGRHEGRIATLATLLGAFPDADYIFDLKSGDPALVPSLASLLRGLGLHDRTWFLTWSRASDRQVADRFPGRLRFPSYRRSAAWAASSVVGLGRLAEPRSRLLSLPAHYHGVPVFGPRLVASIHGRGKIFMGYLVNTAADRARCEACGVRAVLTDRPDLFSG